MKTNSKEKRLCTFRSGKKLQESISNDTSENTKDTSDSISDFVFFIPHAWLLRKQPNSYSAAQFKTVISVVKT